MTAYIFHCCVYDVLITCGWYLIILASIAQTDFVVRHKRKEQLARYDKYFRKFEFTKALDAAMKVS